jgi:hypothetical protein
MDRPRGNMNTNEDVSKVVLVGADRVMTRNVYDDDGENNYNRWQVSSPIPGKRIINTWEIYFGIWLVFAKAENDHYQLFQTIDRNTYTLVHDHATKIHGVCWIGAGHMVFCAEDGWWRSTDSGTTWTNFFSSDYPVSASICCIKSSVGHDLYAYGQDNKIYVLVYYDVDEEWAEVFDTTEISVTRQYPAIDGAPVGILAGVGPYLYRSLDDGESWALVAEVPGIIKNIRVSNKTNTPIFLIEVESLTTEASSLYWTNDLGETLVQEMNRVGPISGVQSVYPTGQTEVRTQFVVLSRRSEDDRPDYQILEP